MFISRLSAHTTCATVAAHIMRETGLRIKPYKFTPRDGMCSFFIKAEARHRVILSDGNLWPRYSIVRPFYE